MGRNPLRNAADFVAFWRALIRTPFARALACVAIVAAALAPSTAHAQTGGDPAANVAGADSTVAIVSPLSITKLRDLDFGSIIATPAGGTVVLDPSGNDGCTASGVLHVGSVCQPADFGGAGESGRVIRVKTPSEIIITGPGDDMLIDAITLDTSPDLTYVNGSIGGNGFVRYRIASASGVFRIRLGGTLNVNPDQAQGEYTGTFEVRLEYQ